jgi:hypothetical protein
MKMSSIEKIAKNNSIAMNNQGVKTQELLKALENAAREELKLNNSQ